MLDFIKDNWLWITITLTAISIIIIIKLLLSQESDISNIIELLKELHANNKEVEAAIRKCIQLLYDNERDQAIARLILLADSLTRSQEAVTTFLAQLP